MKKEMCQVSGKIQSQYAQSRQHPRKGAQSSEEPKAMLGNENRDCRCYGSQSHICHYQPQCQCKVREGPTQPAFPITEQRNQRFG